MLPSALSKADFPRYLKFRSKGITSRYSDGIQGAGTATIIATLYDSYGIIANYMVFMEATEGYNLMLGSAT